MKKFTVEEFKNYLLLQDSMGDILYNLSEENIINSNVKKKEDGYNEYGQYLCDELDKAISKYGKYTYHDKGAHEIMFIGSYIKELNEKSITEVANILSYVLDNHNDPYDLVTALIGDMDNREDFDELFKLDERFDSIILFNFLN